MPFLEAILWFLGVGMVSFLPTFICYIIRTANEFLIWFSVVWFFVSILIIITYMDKIANFVDDKLHFK